jgi:hypothetical protein
MPEDELLTAIAQIALGTAGFAGIIAAMSTRSGPWLPLDKARLGLLLRNSFTVVIFSLLPLGLFSALADHASAWRLSSAGYLCAYLTLPWRARGAFRLAQAHPGAKSMPLGFAVVAADVFAALLLVANIASVAKGWPHLAALGITLSGAFVVFVELLMLSLPGE